ncbi:M15 family metallopeptidase [Kocuria flava]|uniref:M15 family metallopeptidase n=1 Tax=Kocuria flava TaxID=446860 RepID=UPI002F93C01A
MRAPSPAPRHRLPRPAGPRLLVAGLLAAVLTGCGDAGPGPAPSAPASSAPGPAAASPGGPVSSGGPGSAAASPGGGDPEDARGPAADSPVDEAPGADPGTAAPPPELDDPASPAVVVNKRRPLDPPRWAPAALEDVEGVRLRPEAARDARRLLAAARADGVRIVALSGYRSYDEQAAVYGGWVARQGRAAADTASARPGHSEHQTGLALDVGQGGGCDLQVCFADTPAAAWVAEHAAEHGFVVRYPFGEHPTTGYWYEPWHLRHLGAERAREYASSGAATLEEFSGLGPAPDYGPGR